MEESNTYFNLVNLFLCLFIYLCQVTKETIVNCWKKSGIIDYTESIEKVENYRGGENYIRVRKCIN